jgi:hypothetical protein
LGVIVAVEYSEYFYEYPDAYAKIVAGLNRVQTLYQYLVDSGLLDDVDTILSIGSGTGEVEIPDRHTMGRSVGRSTPIVP